MTNWQSSRARYRARLAAPAARLRSAPAPAGRSTPSRADYAIIYAGTIICGLILGWGVAHYLLMTAMLGAVVWIRRS